MKENSKVHRIAFVGNHLPRKCVIAKPRATICPLDPYDPTPMSNPLASRLRDVFFQDYSWMARHSGSKFAGRPNE
jgi:hypothetical protein